MLFGFGIYGLKIPAPHYVSLLTTPPTGKRQGRQEQFFNLAEQTSELHMLVFHFQLPTHYYLSLFYAEVGNIVEVFAENPIPPTTDCKTSRGELSR